MRGLCAATGIAAAARLWRVHSTVTAVAAGKQAGSKKARRAARPAVATDGPRNRRTASPRRLA